LFACLVGCKGDPDRPDAGDVYNPPWFHPKPGEIKNWDIQLTGYDFAAQRDMYIVDLWDVVPSARMLDYGDGDPVAVPAGSQATRIAALKAARTTVICHVGTGAIKLTDPDARKFPGFEATPPNRPTMVKAGSVIGWSTSLTDANERFLDIRTASRPMFEKYIIARIDLAKAIGCDGIAANHNDATAYQDDVAYGTGFAMIAAAEQTSWIVALAKKSHDIEISIGGRGGHAATGIEALVDDYDWLIAERCTEIPDCDQTRPFIEAKRAVFGLDYDVTQEGMASSKTTTCQRWADTLIDGVIKKATLDGSFREVCN
jgi:hypothetical protein